MDDELWDLAGTWAETHGTSRSAIILAALQNPERVLSEPANRPGVYTDPPQAVSEVIPERGVYTGPVACEHPRARVLKGFCGACGTGGL